MIPGTNKISIVSPVYNAENTLDELVKEIKGVLGSNGRPFEIVLVDDGSRDDSWASIEALCKDHKEVVGVKLSRNFGQHQAVTAALQEATGECIIIVDCDLQDDPDHFKLMLEKYEEGYDIVFTKRIKRQHSLFKKLTAIVYNRLFSIFGDSEFDLDYGSLTLLSGKVRNEFLKVSDQDRLYIQILKWLGFNSTVVHVEHRKRHKGRSNYSPAKLIKIAIQGWTFHSSKLLNLSIISGLTLSLLSFVAIAYIVIMYFSQGYRPGWTSVFVGILFSTGIIQLSIGIVGIYIGKIFKQVKARPLYIIEKRLNGEERDNNTV